MSRLVAGAAGLWLLIGTEVAGADAGAVAQALLAALRDGDAGRAAALYETERWRSTPADPAVYFRYESGAETNLAFLLGGRFDVGQPEIRHNIRSEWYVIDGIKGSTVTVPLTFSEPHRPFLLPSPVAFGREMSFVDFLDFVKHPEETRFDGFSLCLRPTVAAGRIRPPVVKSGEPLVPPPPSARGIAMNEPVMALGEQRRLWRQPRDPGPVRLPSGEVISERELERFLPRLARIHLVLQIVRRGWWAPWRISGVNLAEAVVVSDGVEARLR